MGNKYIPMTPALRKAIKLLSLSKEELLRLVREELAEQRAGQGKKRAPKKKKPTRR